tara:strand:+ start:5911 stop:6024 length:114 start_codon:yes stop_codon:yes gene_type:complete
MVSAAFWSLETSTFLKETLFAFRNSFVFLHHGHVGVE